MCTDSVHVFFRFWFSGARSRSFRGCGCGLGWARSGSGSNRFGKGFDGRFWRHRSRRFGVPKNRLFELSGREGLARLRMGIFKGFAMLIWGVPGRLAGHAFHGQNRTQCSYQCGWALQNETQRIHRESVARVEEDEFHPHWLCWKSCRIVFDITGGVY